MFVTLLFQQWLSIQFLSISLCLSLSEYVNAQEVPTDMKSITDRAAQTLLWTELFRGETYPLTSCNYTRLYLCVRISSLHGYLSCSSWSCH